MYWWTKKYNSEDIINLYQWWTQAAVIDGLSVKPTSQQATQSQLNQLHNKDHFPAAIIVFPWLHVHF